MHTLAKNEIYRTEITDINNMGCGVARVKGVVVFVAHGVTGDVAEIKIIKVAAGYAAAIITELLKPSPLRLPEAACAAARRCGGCQYQHITYEHECSLKQNYVRQALAKAGAPHIPVAELLTTGVTAGYRNKSQIPVGTDKNGRLCAGFYAPRSHDIIAADKCLLQPPSFSEITAFIMDFARENGISAYSEARHAGLLRHIYIRGARSGEIMVCLVLNGESLPGEQEFASRLRERFPMIAGVLVNVNTEKTNVICGRRCRTLSGSPFLTDVLCGLTFRISPLSFYQVNHDAAELLYRKGAELLALTGRETLLDLYCGIGTIGLTMAHRVKKLIGIEVVEDAVENARANAEINGIENASFYCGDAGRVLENLYPRQSRPDAVIVDPPRKGLAPDALKSILEIAPEKLLYISCNPDTLARDIVQLEAGGYRCGAVTPADLFPRTGHVESVVLMTKIQK